MRKLYHRIGLSLMIFGAALLPLLVLLVLFVDEAGFGFIVAILADLVVTFLGAFLFVRAKGEPPMVSHGTCSACGLETLVLPLEFQECRSYVLVRREREVEGKLCWRCARQIYLEFTQNNLIGGWWSPPGLIRTPMLLMVNLVYYLRARALRPTGHSLAA